MDGIIGLFGSKKFVAAVISSVLAFVGVMNDFTIEQIAAVIGPMISFILAQGIADQGKEKALIEKFAVAKNASE